MQKACAVLYCDLCAVQLYNVFPRYLINGSIFGKSYCKKVLIFSTILCKNFSFS